MRSANVLHYKCILLCQVLIPHGFLLSLPDEDEEEAGPSRHTRHRSSHRNAGAHGHAEGSAGALGGNSRFPSRLRHVVSRYSPEADGAAFPDRHARRRDGDAQHSAPSQGQAAPSRRRSQEHPAAGPSGRGEPAPASAAPGRFSAPVVRLRVSSRLHGLETPPIAQLLRSHPPSLPPPAAAVDGAGRPPRRAAAAAVQPLLPSPGASPEPEQRRRASLRGNMREQSTPALQNGAADSAGPAASVEDGAPRSQEPSPGRPTRRRAASMTPSLPCAGANGTAHSNGDAAAVGGGRWPRRQGSRSAEKRAVPGFDESEEEDRDGGGSKGAGRRRRGPKGRQRSLQELHKAEGGPQQDDGDAETDNVLVDPPRRTSSGLRIRFTRNEMSP
jgi:hypothetical protein